MVFPRKRQNSENSLRLGGRVAQTNKTISCLLLTRSWCPLPSMDNSMVASSVLAAFVVSSAVVLQVQVGTKTAGQLRCQRRNDGGNARRRDTVSVAGAGDIVAGDGDATPCQQQGHSGNATSIELPAPRQQWQSTAITAVDGGLHCRLCGPAAVVDSGSGDGGPRWWRQRSSLTAAMAVFFNGKGKGEGGIRQRQTRARGWVQPRGMTPSCCKGKGKVKGKGKGKGKLLHRLSSSSHCAPHRPLVLSSRRLVVASPLLSTHHPLFVSSSRRLVFLSSRHAASCYLVMPACCRAIISCRPLVAPPSCPLIMLAGCCVACTCTALLSSRCSSSPMPLNTVERCCRHRTPPPPLPLNAVSIVHRCHSCRPSPPSNANAHLRPSPHRSGGVVSPPRSSASS